MPEIPNTRFINFADTPAIIQYDQNGEALVPLESQGQPVVDISGFRTISIRIGQATASSFRLGIGKIKGATLAQSFSQPLDLMIHTFDVIGPQMNLALIGAKPNSEEKVQLWVYLRS